MSAHEIKRGHHSLPSPRSERWLDQLHTPTSGVGRGPHGALCLIDDAQLNSTPYPLLRIRQAPLGLTSSPSSSICEAWKANALSCITWGGEHGRNRDLRRPMDAVPREPHLHVLATLARLGVGSEAVIPILGYRLQLLATHAARRRFLPDTRMVGRDRVPAVSASGNRWQLRTEAGYARHGGQKKPCRVR